MGQEHRTTRRTPGQWLRSLPAEERRSIIGMAVVILVLHIVGWGGLALAGGSAHIGMGASAVVGLGLGLTAYTLGMRHAFDADHLAAIDNVTRKLLAEGRRPVSVGFWFSLGHSTVVFVLVALLALGVRAVAGQLENDSSLLQQVTGVIGPTISSLFLYLIAIINLVLLLGVVRVFRRMRRGQVDEAALDAKLAGRGILTRVFRRMTSAIRTPRRMYPLGFLFGLGFDTATEIGLLVIAGSAAALNLPWWVILTLPILFAAGMSLLDTIDGWVMTYAYGWALATPVRKVFYNITITGLSILIAVAVATIQVASILTDAFGVDGGPLAAVGGVDLTYAGYGIVVLFLLLWAGAVLIWRFGRIEQRWAVPERRSQAPAAPASRH